MWSYNVQENRKGEFHTRFNIIFLRIEELSIVYLLKEFQGEKVCGVYIHVTSLSACIAVHAEKPQFYTDKICET